jgi:hypothetical protein
MKLAFISAAADVALVQGLVPCIGTRTNFDYFTQAALPNNQIFLISARPSYYRQNQPLQPVCN